MSSNPIRFTRHILPSAGFPLAFICLMPKMDSYSATISNKESPKVGKMPTPSHKCTDLLECFFPCRSSVSASRTFFCHSLLSRLPVFFLCLDPMHLLLLIFLHLLLIHDHLNRGESFWFPVFPSQSFWVLTARFWAFSYSGNSLRLSCWSDASLLSCVAVIPKPWFTNVYKARNIA